MLTFLFYMSDSVADKDSLLAPIMEGADCMCNSTCSVLILVHAWLVTIDSDIESGTAICIRLAVYTPDYTLACSQ